MLKYKKNLILKLTEFLKRNSAESEVLLQEFQNRLDKKGSSTVTTKDSSALLKSKDDRIAELEKLLAKSNVNEAPVTGAQVVSDDTRTLDQVQKEYADRFDKEVPARFKNDKSWIVEKLSE